MVHGASTFSITTFSILTIGLEGLYESAEGLYVTLSIEVLYDTHHRELVCDTQH
jgi:hypothetical protein